MNRTEARYAQHLELLRRANELDLYRYEAVKLRLADKTFYTPDFMVLRNGFVEFHEVKGFMIDDANVKLKTAASQYSEFRFLLVKLKKNEWLITEVKSFPT